MIQIGDTVKIINYGHLMWENKKFHPQQLTNWPIYKENENARWIDMQPELIGQIGIVVSESKNKFTLSGVKGKIAPFDLKQLQKISE